MIECMPRHPSADGSRQKTLGKRHHRRRVMGLSIWSENKTTESSVEKCVLAQTKESPHATFTSKSDADHLFWPSGNGASWVCSSRANSKPTLLQGSSDSSYQQNSSKTKSFLVKKNLDLASRQCSCPHSPQHKTVLGLERNHHVASSILFAGLIPLRFLFFSKTERDSQGDTLPRSRGYQNHRDETPQNHHKFLQCFKAWSKRMEKCIKANGEYFEGDK